MEGVTLKECVLCYEEREYFMTGACGHMEICYVCAHKQRVKLQKTACALCNVTLFDS